jgi:hypothetical protein
VQIYLLGIPDACPENGEDKCYASANTGKSFVTCKHKEEES